MHKQITFTASEIASRVKGQVIGNSTTVITGLASASHARTGDLTFAENEKHFASAEQSAAAAVLTSAEFPGSQKVLIRVPNPRIAMAHLLPLFFPQDQPQPGIDPSASIDPTSSVDPTAHIGPHCIIAAGVKIGPRAVLMGGNYIGKNCILQDEVRLHPNVVIYPGAAIGKRVIIHAGTVIGSDGYGYVMDAGKHCKVLQVGNVVIGDDVEIGANTAIDRGALGPTTIGNGTKIDNLVHIAHNVTIGNNCLVLGQVGFAGSTTVGDYSVIASQSGIAGHLQLGKFSTVAAKSGVMRDVGEKETVLGIPAQPDKQTKRQWIALQKLPDMMRRFREMEQELESLKARLPG